MDNDCAKNTESHLKSNDEIDIVELILKLWRNKWLIIALVIVITGATLIYLTISPAPPKTYTVKSSLRIGIVGSYTVQSPEEIVNSVRQELYTEARRNNEIINDITPKIVTSNPEFPSYSINFEANSQNIKGKFVYTIKLIAKNKSVDFSIQTLSATMSATRARKIGDFIIKKHDPIYNKAITQAQEELSSIKRMPVYVDRDYIKMKLLYENEKHPTDYIIEPLAPSNPDPLSRKILLKTSFAFITSIFLGIFITLFHDYVSAIKRGIKERL